MRPDTIRIVEEPAVEPVTLSEAKLQVGLMDDQTDFDGFLADRIAAARRLIERRLSVTLVATKYRARWREAPAVLHLPNPPLLYDGDDYDLEITADGVAVAPSAYAVDEDAQPAEVTLTGQTGRISVEYWGGRPEGSPIAPQIKAAILLYVAHMFENRGVLATDSAVELPQAFEALLASESVNGGY
jgi:uncharacterized phiE125 gp8 family phage protein